MGRGRFLRQEVMLGVAFLNRTADEPVRCLIDPGDEIDRTFVFEGYPMRAIEVLSNEFAGAPQRQKKGFTKSSGQGL